MKLQVGFELIYECPQPTPMMLMLNIHHTRAPDLVVPDLLVTDPGVTLTPYRDSFG
ncbi:MAG: transglutaminase family protein, partial [Alphaproteobacteria bacterium]